MARAREPRFVIDAQGDERVQQLLHGRWVEEAHHREPIALESCGELTGVLDDAAPMRAGHGSTLAPAPAHLDEHAPAPVCDDRRYARYCRRSIMWELRPSVLTLLERNNARIRRIDLDRSNPRPTHGLPWYRSLASSYPEMRQEWDAFTDAGGDLPLIEDVLGFPDQNQGSYWKLAPIVSQGRPVRPVTRAFPATTAALRAVPGLRSACWSVLGPGGWIPEHVGENAGCLRLLFSVDGGGAHFSVARTTIPCIDGEGLLFDDTVVHAADNPASQPRVVILCDILRPLPGLAALQNRLTQQALHHLTPAYRRSASRASERFRGRNPHLFASGRPA